MGLNQPGGSGEKYTEWPPAQSPLLVAGSRELCKHLNGGLPSSQVNKCLVTMIRAVAVIPKGTLGPPYAKSLLTNSMVWEDHCSWHLFSRASSVRKSTDASEAVGRG